MKRLVSAAVLAFVGLLPAAASAQGVARPYKVHMNWTALDIDWFYFHGDTPSDFDGRCSVPSTYVIYATFEGEATHLGHVTGQTSHCSQVDFTTGAATYSDGLFTMVGANGDAIYGHYDNGVSGVDPQSGTFWFVDDFTITGGTGRFEGASGEGQEGGSFSSFDDLLNHVPVPMWEEGTITYQPGRK